MLCKILIEKNNNRFHSRNTSPSVIRRKVLPAINPSFVNSLPIFLKICVLLVVTFGVGFESVMKFSEKLIFYNFFDFFNFIFDIKNTLQVEKKLFLKTFENHPFRNNNY
jgi:hypothetical protein